MSTMFSTLARTVALVITCAMRLHAHGDTYAANETSSGAHPSVRRPFAWRDTIRTRTHEVVVEAARPALPTLMAHTRSSELRNDEVRRLQTRQSSELLGLLPGVFVRDYGGLAGIKTISLRGTTAAQNAVYLDGVRLNGSQNGLFDFSTLPSSFLSSLVVSDAVDATLSGSHAVGGLVMLQSLHTRDTALRLRLQADAASWNERGANAQAFIPIDFRSQLNVAADVRSSRGDYPFAYSNFGTTSTFRRTNADYSSLNAMMAFVYHDTAVSTTTRVMLRSGDRGAPDAVTQGNIGNSSARLVDESLLVLHTATRRFDASELRWNVFTNMQSQQFSDTSTSLLGVPFRQRFFSRDAGAALSFHAVTIARDELAVRVEAAYSDVRGDLLRFKAGNLAERRSAGAGMSLRSRPFLLSDALELYVLAGIRCDVQSDASAQWTPRSSLLLRIKGGLDISVHVSQAFRLPSFNELYYQNYGSVNLVPEQSNTWRLSAEYTIVLDTLTEVVLSAKAFGIDTKNQIVAIPRSPVTWSASNIAAVRSRGAELGAVARLGSWLNIRGGVTVQDVRDDTRDARNYGRLIPYTPSTLAYMRCDVAYDGFTVGGGLQTCGVRYTQTDNDPASALRAYTTLGVNAGYEWRTHVGTWMLRVDCDNAMDAAYTVIANYPMPGRMLRASLQWNW